MCLLQIYRSSAVFNAFLSNLPQMLDQNHLMGGSMLDVAIHTLLYCPSTANICNAQSESSHNIIYSYTLWRLEAHIRRNWLMAAEVIMYKVILMIISYYFCGGSLHFHDLSQNNIFFEFLSVYFQYEYTQLPLSNMVNSLIRIILNSLEAQFHRCKRIPATVVMEMPMRSRGKADYPKAVIQF